MSSIKQNVLARKRGGCFVFAEGKQPIETCGVDLMTRWGLVGASAIARERVIGAIRAVGDEIVSVMSTDGRRGRSFADEHAIPRSVDSLDALVGDAGIDAVYISTTNELHRDQAIAAARAGKHILCEKPLATSVGDARAMVDEARSQGVVFATNHHMRGAGSHSAMRDAIAAGKIGRPIAARVLHSGYLPERLQGWRLDRPAAGGGAVFDLTVHDTDTLRYILRDDPVEVVSLAQRGGMASNGLEDAAMTSLRFQSGLIAQFHDGFTTPYAITGVEIHGTHGSLFAPKVMGQEPTGTVVLRTADGDADIPFDRVDLYERTVRDFNQAIAGEGEPLCSGQDGVWSLATACAVLESIRTNAMAKVVFPG